VAIIISYAEIFFSVNIVYIAEILCHTHSDDSQDNSGLRYNIRCDSSTS